MVVRSIGNALLVILPELIGKKITNWFDLVRPLIAFKFQTVSETNLFGPIRIETNLHDCPSSVCILVDIESNE